MDSLNGNELTVHVVREIVELGGVYKVVDVFLIGSSTVMLARLQTADILGPSAWVKPSDTENDHDSRSSRMGEAGEKWISNFISHHRAGGKILVLKRFGLRHGE